MKLFGEVVLALVGILGTLGCQAHSPAEQGPAPVYVEMKTSQGDVAVELDVAHAPISVANFLAYADKGEYDNTVFHRIIPNFVIQGGGFTAELVEKKGNALPAIKNEWQNGLKNVRGTIAMARDAEPDTATREFYFNMVDNARLDIARPQTGAAGYAVFGRVVRGMQVLDAIRYAPTTDHPEKDMENVPVRSVILLSVQRVSAHQALTGNP